MGTRTKLRLPPLGTEVGGNTKFAGFVPILNDSGKLSSTLLPPEARTYISTKSFTIEYPNGGEVIPLVYTPGPFAVTQIIAQTTGISTDAVTFNLHFGPDTDLNGTKVVTTDIVDLVSDGVKKVTALNNFEVPEDVFLWVKIASVTGTPVQFHVTVVYV